MHPDAAFALDAAACRAFARERAFAHLFVRADAGIAVVHTPL